jgi:hypothetical protein
MFLNQQSIWVKKNGIRLFFKGCTVEKSAPHIFYLKFSRRNQTIYLKMYIHDF